MQIGKASVGCLAYLLVFRSIVSMLPEQDNLAGDSPDIGWLGWILLILMISFIVTWTIINIQALLLSRQGIIQTFVLSWKLIWHNLIQIVDNYLAIICFTFIMGFFMTVILDHFLKLNPDARTIVLFFVNRLITTPINFVLLTVGFLKLEAIYYNKNEKRFSQDLTEVPSTQN